MEKLRKEIIAPSADDIVAILQEFAEAEIDFTPYVNEKIPPIISDNMSSSKNWKRQSKFTPRKKRLLQINARLL